MRFPGSSPGCANLTGMAVVPMVTGTLALRVGRSEVDHMAAWLKEIGKLQGNPFGAEITKFGGATALVGRDLGPLFNRVLGFGDPDVESLDAMIDLYAAEDLPCRIDVNPHSVGAATMRRLVEAGFCPFRHHDHLFGLPETPEPAGRDRSTDVLVSEIGEEDRAAWADVWRLGFLDIAGIAEADGALVAEATSNLFRDPRWTLFLARHEGSPAAAAALYVENGVGSLALAGTHPGFLRRGCQTALLNARLRKAAELGCEWVAAQAALDAQSHRNLQRAGLRVAYTRAF